MIQLSNVFLSYSLGQRKVSVLQEVNLRILQGEMVAILGPSGSGKSTLLYILGALLKPSEGSYQFSGREVTKLSSDGQAELRAQDIGFIFQQFHLLPRLSALKNVILSSRYASQESAEERARSLLTGLGLQDHLSHYPNQLSGGQQQRVAIARALMNEPSLILADEPTGNLDSKSSAEVLTLLREINQKGSTVIIVTHDPKVAASCERVIHVMDGRIVKDENSSGRVPQPGVRTPKAARSPFKLNLTQHIALATENLFRNKGRTALTMLGVIVGIAAVLSSISLGGYTKSKILETYESLGVNKMVVRAHTRWTLKATDIQGPVFEGISMENDINPMKRIFREIRLISPVNREWIDNVESGGRTFDDARLLGITPEYFEITNRRLILGQRITDFHMARNSGVCVIGFDIARKLFSKTSPLLQPMQLSLRGDEKVSCLIIGVLAPQSSNNEWFKPNEQILAPLSFVSLVLSSWRSKPSEFNLQIKSGASPEELAEKIKNFFASKYGRSAEVRVDADDLLLAQMRKFLNLFAILLTGVAFVSLAVGGVGITNMMFVAISERIKEIGLRKALGARDSEIRAQFLIEALILCSLAGFLGILAGILGYHSLLYLASQLSEKVKFEWFFNPYGILLALISMLAVGLISGMFPALKAEKLEVVEALRNEL